MRARSSAGSAALMCACDKADRLGAAGLRGSEQIARGLRVALLERRQIRLDGGFRAVAIALAAPAREQR